MKSFGEDFKLDSKKIIKNDLVDELIYSFKKKYKERQTKTKKLSSILFLNPNKKINESNVEELLKINSKNSKTIKKQVVIKNIGNLKLNHLKSALDYAMSHNDNLNDLKVDSHIHNALEYIMNSSNIIDENGESISSSIDVLKLWKDDISNQRKNTNLAWHLVFSIDEVVNKENLKILQQSVYDSLNITLGGEYKFILAIHSHQNKPHCHVIVNKTNIFNKKKLHFKNKDEIKDFFFDLRENFKYSLASYSGGKFIYDNRPKDQIDFYNKKIKDLEVYKSDKYINYFNFNSHIEKIIYDLRKKEKSLDLNQEKLKNIINEIVKLKQSMQGNNEAINLLDNENYDKLLSLLKQKCKEYEMNDKNIIQINKDIDSIKLFNQTIRNHLKDLSIQKQKEIIVKNFKRKNISKDSINKILLLEQELAHKKATKEKNIEQVFKGFDTNISKINSKTNLFVLIPMQENITKYKNILENDEDINKIQLSNDKLLDLISERLKFLLLALQRQLDSEDNVEEEYKNRFIKNTKYMINEIGYGINYLNKEDEEYFKKTCKAFKNLLSLIDSNKKESINKTKENMQDKQKDVKISLPDKEI